MRLAIILCLGLVAGGCDDRVAQPKLEPLTRLQANDARNSVGQLVGKKGRALTICGQSDGLGLFALDWESGFSQDGMKDGRLIFLTRDDGREDVYFRDAIGRYRSSLDDGGEINRISYPDREIDVWIVSYPSTGIVETHNIMMAPKDGLVDLWTSNKPNSLIGASAKLFRSTCIRA